MKPILSFVIPGCALTGDSRAKHGPESITAAVVMDSGSLAARFARHSHPGMTKPDSEAAHRPVRFG